MERLADFEHYRDTFAISPEILYQQGFAQQPLDFYCLMARHAEGGIEGYWWTISFPSRPGPGPRSFIKELLVAEDDQGQGVGEALMRAAARAAVAHSCGVVRWAVASWNEAGRRFYERLGA